MEIYKGYFIHGGAKTVHPFSREWHVAGSVLKPGRLSSIVEVARFQISKFTVDDKEVAEWFGTEICRIAVDECLPAL